MGEKIKVVRGSGNVFIDRGFPKEEAACLLLHSLLMNELERFLHKKNLTRA